MIREEEAPVDAEASGLTVFLIPTPACLLGRGPVSLALCSSIRGEILTMASVNSSTKRHILELSWDEMCSFSFGWFLT